MSLPIIKPIVDWSISLKNKGTKGRIHKNPNKYNYLSNDNTCKIIGCNNTFYRSRKSGLCDNHANHQHDLFLELTDPSGQTVSVPAHKEIIDALILWSSTRNFGLLPFFASLSFNVLGNVPDVTTLYKDIIHEGVSYQSMNNIYDALLLVIDNYFPRSNNSSLQPLKTAKSKIPAIVLAHTFAGLLICEEANRGDRWFNRVVRKDESTTTQLGAAMPIAYFATRIFPWGVEMSKQASHKLTL